MEYIENGMKLFELTVNKLAKEKGYNFSLHYMQNDTLYYKDTRFICATLWTDYMTNDWVAKRVAKKEINDYYVISLNNRNITPDDLYKKHLDSRSYIEGKLKEEFIGTTVVVTHHAPYHKSIDCIYTNKYMNHSFFSHLGSLVVLADLWIHGHCHNSSDYKADNTRVICNPRGYYGHSLNMEFTSKLIETNDL